MRVAVHFPDGSVAAYRLGRIVEGEHNVRLDTGETTPIAEFLGNLIDRAKAEYPEAEVLVERLVHDGEETCGACGGHVAAEGEPVCAGCGGSGTSTTSKWVSVDAPDQGEPAPAGQTVQAEPAVAAAPVAPAAEGQS